MRKIAVVTGTRAEYGLLYWIIKGIHDDKELELQLIVTGAHLSAEFGLTVKEIENDRFPIAERVDMMLSSDTEAGVATSMGIGMSGFAKAYEHLRPDIILVLGDRFEIFSAVSAAVPFRIPVAHIHGGEVTEGAMDEQFRHAITKMSHIHFTSTDTYRHRVIQMGEKPGKVYCYGAPGLDNIHKLKLLNKQQLAKELDLPSDKVWGLITYHPVTLEKASAERQTIELLKAVKTFPEIFWVFTMPNADTESRVIIKEIKAFVRKNTDKARFFTSLGQLKYLSLLQYAQVMAGNSSSGIIEAASFKLPVVNIGSRQDGRIRIGNVIDVPACKKAHIAGSISKAISDTFRDSLRKTKNPYGRGNTSQRIVTRIKKISLKNIVKKEFHNVSVNEEN